MLWGGEHWQLLSSRVIWIWNIGRWLQTLLHCRRSVHGVQGSRRPWGTCGVAVIHYNEVWVETCKFCTNLGGAKDAIPRIQFLSYSFQEKNWPNNMLVPPLWTLMPSLWEILDPPFRDTVLHLIKRTDWNKIEKILAIEYSKSRRILSTLPFNAHPKGRHRFAILALIWKEYYLALSDYIIIRSSVHRHTKFQIYYF